MFTSEAVHLLKINENFKVYKQIYEHLDKKLFHKLILPK